VARASPSAHTRQVVLTHEQRKPTHEEDIKAVHASIGSAVDAVLQRFTDRVNRHFHPHASRR